MPVRVNMDKDTAMPPASTGKVRARELPHRFKYVLEEEQSDGTWKVLLEHGEFPSVEDAKAHFERAKKSMRKAPAEIGNWNDA